MRCYGLYLVVVGICILSVTGFCQGQVDGQPVTTPTPREQFVLRSEMSMKEREKMGKFGRHLPVDFQIPTDDIARKLLREYGTVFIARNGVTPPKTVVFRDQNEVTAFQKSVDSQTELIGAMPMTLQAAAMRALISAIEEAKVHGLSITPRDVDAASRSYDESVGLWASRVEPALTHWVGRKKITATDAERIRSLPPFEQVSEVLLMEKKRIWFAKDLTKSIIYSVAPPGTSQHLSMLAFDVKEFENAQVRAILAKHGWYQTVVSDLPHFTYLGVAEHQLKELGLKRVRNGGRVFWVPDI